MGTRAVSVSKVIPASPDEVFAVLADPAQHPKIDGSGSVKEVVGHPPRLALGSRFGMSMKLGMPYRITNTVVEFEEGQRIAWRHFAGHRWRYELAAAAGGGTEVTETFDWSTSKTPWALEWLGVPAKNERSMAKTLDRLAEHVAAPA